MANEELVERLRRLALRHYSEPNDPCILDVAADLIAAQSQSSIRMREALEPLKRGLNAFEASYDCDPGHRDFKRVGEETSVTITVTYGELLRVREALAKERLDQLPE